MAQGRSYIDASLQFSGGGVTSDQMKRELARFFKAPGCEICKKDTHHERIILCGGFFFSCCFLVLEENCCS